MFPVVSSWDTTSKDMASTEEPVKVAMMIITIYIVV
jgi:hypothetical protein